MKNLIIVCLLVMPLMSWAKCGNKGNNFCQVKATRVYDGDTFFINIPKIHTLFGVDLGVRVYGVDTPELRGGSAYEKTMAKKAKAFTADAVMKAKRVDLVECKKGKYFRIVCKVIYDGKNLSEELIKNSLAVKYMEK